MAHHNLNAGIPYSATAVTKHDTNMNAYTCLYIGGAGDVAVETENGETVTFSAVPAGSFLWMRTNKVKSTNTTATLILGLK